MLNSQTNGTNFITEKERYKWKEEEPIILPLSPVLAKPFMTDIQARTVSSACFTHTVWLR